MAEYIERKLLIDEFDRLGLGDHSFVERVFSDGVRTIIAGIPAADVAPVVHGRWAAKGYVCGESEFECSVCHKSEWRTTISQFKFCPFCGAKMDGDEE